MCNYNKCNVVTIEIIFTMNCTAVDVDSTFHHGKRVRCTLDPDRRVAVVSVHICAKYSVSWIFTKNVHQERNQKLMRVVRRRGWHIWIVSTNHIRPRRYCICWSFFDPASSANQDPPYYHGHHHHQPATTTTRPCSVSNLEHSCLWKKVTRWRIQQQRLPMSFLAISTSNVAVVPVGSATMGIKFCEPKSLSHWKNIVLVLNARRNRTSSNESSIHAYRTGPDS